MKATVKVFNTFPQITARIERAAQEGVQAAAEEAAIIAQLESKHKLELSVVDAHPDVGAEGYSAGIISRRRSDNPGQSTPLAHIFNDGTLGKRRRPPKRPGKSSWRVKASERASAHTAERRSHEGGIEGEHFFEKARKAGRAKLKERIAEELH
jgi:hypothetical protein